MRDRLARPMALEVARSAADRAEPVKTNPFPEVLGQRLVDLLGRWFERRTSVGGRPWPELGHVLALRDGQVVPLASGVCLVPSTRPRESDLVDEIGWLVFKRGLLTARQINVLEAYFLLRERPGEGEDWTDYLTALWPGLGPSAATERYLWELRVTLVTIQRAARSKSLL